MSIEILFLCKKRGGYTQGRFGLYNSATFVINALRAVGVSAEIDDADDANCIDKLVTKWKPKIVILEAIWVTPEKLKEIVRLHPGVRFIVRVHSKLTFLAEEGIAVEWLKLYQRVPGASVAGNNLEFVRDMKWTGIHCVYLPNIYKPTYRFQYSPRSDKYVHVGCFGSPRPMKNQLAQAAAAMAFAEQIGKPLAFHINTPTIDKGTMSVVKALSGMFLEHPQHKLVQHEWQDHADFCKLVATMDVGMQVSLSESFNIVSADFVWNGVPIVASKEISFVEHEYRVDNHTDSIIQALHKAYRAVGTEHLDKNLSLLCRFNEESLKIWLAFIFR